MNEGIFTASASKQRKIFSQVTRAKKEIFKNASKTQPAVKEEKQMLSFQQLRYSLVEKLPTTPEVNEAVTVKKADYSWGKMMTVHHGASTSYPLHPEHQQAIAKLGDGEKTSFKDETNSTVHAHREGDTVHLTRPKTSSTKTSVAHSQFNEETVVETKGAPKGFHFTRDGKLKRGDANQDGNGGPMLRSDPLDKQRSKVPAVSEAENPCWDGYKMLGMKNKGGKKVPNCIPEEQHYCAKHVYSNMFGEGLVVEGIHAEPDEEGNVEWYAVQFNEGIKKVFTEKLEVMIAEFHGNHTKKKPKR